MAGIIALETQFRSPHLDAAAAQLTNAGDSLRNHGAWLQQAAAAMELEIKDGGTAVEEKVKRLEALQAAVRAANPTPAPEANANVSN